MIYEQCVRTFWHSDRYKDDLRFLKVWLEYVMSFSFSSQSSFSILVLILVEVLLSLMLKLVGRLKTVLMLKSYTLFSKQTKLERLIPCTTYHIPCTWNQRTKLKLQTKHLILGYLGKLISV